VACSLQAIASSTKVGLDGKRLTDIAPALQNKRVMRKAVKKVQEDKYPEGEGWEGGIHFVSHEMKLSSHFFQE
jgi:hypothetical protein